MGQGTVKTITIALTPELSAQGDYTSTSEANRDALRDWKHIRAFQKQGTRVMVQCMICGEVSIHAPVKGATVTSPMRVWYHFLVRFSRTSAFSTQ